MILDTIQRLRAAVDLEPKNWDLRLVLADALEEAGEDVLAAGQRYQAQEKRCPHYRPASELNDPEIVEDTWEWWAIVESDEDWLPMKLFTLLDGCHDESPVWDRVDSQTWKNYLSPADADAALARALHIHNRGK